MHKKKRNLVLNLNFFIDKNTTLKLVAFMHTILITFYKCNEIMTKKTKNLQTLIIKNTFFFFL